MPVLSKLKRGQIPSLGGGGVYEWELFPDKPHPLRKPLDGIDCLGDHDSVHLLKAKKKHQLSYFTPRTFEYYENAPQ